MNKKSENRNDNSQNKASETLQTEPKIKEEMLKNAEEIKDSSLSEETENLLNPEFLEQMKFLADTFEKEKKKHEEDLLNLKKENLANLENQKKYYEKESENLKKYLFQNFFQDILIIIDSLEVGIKAKAENYEKFLDGLKMTHGIFINTCKKYQVEPILTHVGDAFDDNIHECMGTTESVANNVIANILSSGYKFQDRILRPVKVIVGTK